MKFKTEKNRNLKKLLTQTKFYFRSSKNVLCHLYSGTSW